MTAIIVSAATTSTSASAHATIVGLLGIGLFAAILGIAPGIWVGASGNERRRGHGWLLTIVALLALAAVSIYTFGDSSEPLVVRMMSLPLSIPIAIAGAAILAGIPMYAAYLVGYRIGCAFAKTPKGTGNDGAL